MKCQISANVSFAIMFFITSTYFLVELVIGHLYHSLVLQADAYHMLSDLVSLVVGYIASKISTREAINEKGEIRNTFGWVRSEVVGALVNAIFLGALCFTIAIEALMRYSKPEITDKPLIVMGVAIGGLVLNGIGLILFHDHAHGHSHHHKSKEKSKHIVACEENDLGQEQTNDSNPASTHAMEESAPAQTEKLVEPPDTKVKLKPVIEHSSQMNIKGVYLHIVGDFVGSVIVIINCFCIYFIQQDWVKYLDPTLSLMSVAILLSSSVPLARNAVHILVQTVPKGFDITTIQNELRQQFDQILDIHDFHLWQLVGSKFIATLHIKFKDFNSYIRSSENIKSYFHSIGIHSLTLQPEFYQDDTQEQEDPKSNACLLDCPPGSNCDLKQCCSYNNKS